MAGLPPITQLAGNHRSLFEGYWSLVDQAGSGKVPASSAAEFLKKSQLREPVLHKIWSSSDPSSTGYLDKQAFFLALRLVAACQAGKEPLVGNIALTDPPPRFVGVDVSTQGGFGKWSIELEDQTRYEQLFQSLKPTRGLLLGDKVKPFMLSSKLPLDVLGKVWNMSDIDKDGSLDKDEFAVAMKLISLVQGGETLPPSLPATLIPQSKLKGGVVSSTASTTSLTTSIGGSPRPSQSPVFGGPATPSGVKPITTDWVVSTEIKAKYSTYFQGIDKDQDGYVSGEEARALFIASNLPQPLLAHVWNLCDIENTGRLNSDQFALAMFLIAEKVRGKEVPKKLTPAMIPPSLRKPQSQQTTPPSNTPTHSVESSVTPGIGGWASPMVAGTTWNSTSFGTPTSPEPGLNVTTATNVADTATAWSTPTFDGASNGATTDDVGGFGSDFSSIKELDTISKDVESIRKEKTQISEDILAKQELIQVRKSEVEALQVDVESSARQREDLEKERIEVQNKLEMLDKEKARVDGEVAELKQKCEDEQKEIDHLNKLSTKQEVSKKSQAGELEKLRVQLEELRKEEREYKEKVETSAEELDRLQKSQQSMQREISQTRQKINHYREEHQTLTNTLTLYPPVSTPSSTPSSSVMNINDMGLAQFSSELTTPHLSEPDAISARATAGSSSPVSSISGFSTNSHLDDGGDDSAGSKVDDKRRCSDPFSSNRGNVPFAAFSTADDPFNSTQSGRGGFVGKPSDLSAFDPFGSSDPFKTMSTAPTVPSYDDLFKSDPFGSSASVPPRAAPQTSSGAGTTDPFSGQDPFSLDPFASPLKEEETSSPWGSSSPFSTDPFASHPALSDSDPFSSNDPFGEDPFSSKAIENRGTDKNNGATSDLFEPEKRPEIKIPEPLPMPGPHSSNTDRLRWAQRESEREEAMRKQSQHEEEEALAAAIRESMKS